jgi:hypothetical protein
MNEWILNRRVERLLKVFKKGIFLMPFALSMASWIVVVPC